MCHHGNPAGVSMLMCGVLCGGAGTAAKPHLVAQQRREERERREALERERQAQIKAEVG